MKSVYLFFALLVSAPAFAQEAPPEFETVVEDVVFNTSTRTVIDEKAIKDSRAPNITTLLSSQANITVVSTAFQPNSIFIRGGDSSHVLIIVDGVPFYDASTTQRTFNLNSLDIKSVRRIEIIKGSQTVLYGGQALTGVIKIDTIPDDWKSTSVTGVKGHIGTHAERDFSLLHLEPITENSAALFRGQGTWRDSQSPILESSKTYSRDGWNSEAAYIWKGSVQGHIKGLYIQDRSFSPYSDRVTSNMVDVDNYELYSRQLALSTVLNFTELPWNPRLALGTQNSNRKYDMGLNTYNNAVVEDRYGANLNTIRLDVTPLKNSLFTIQAGASYNSENFVFRALQVEKQNRTSEQTGVFVKTDIRPTENLEFSVGGRLEKWTNNDSVATYQAGVTVFKNTKFEVASGYKIPSLFQLYSSYGNPDLKEEKALQYTLTQDINLSENQQLSLTVFKSEFSDLLAIRGNFPNLRYTNVAKSESKGVEVVYTLRPTADSSLLLTYGYQEPRDVDADQWLARRPLVNGSIRYNQSFGASTASIELMGSGERVDVKGMAQTLTSIPGYVVANAAYSYSFDESLSSYLRVNNLANHRHEETYTYFSEGISAVLGAEYWF